MRSCWLCDMGRVRGYFICHDVEKMGSRPVQTVPSMVPDRSWMTEYKRCLMGGFVMLKVISALSLHLVV